MSAMHFHLLAAYGSLHAGDPWEACDALCAALAQANTTKHGARCHIMRALNYARTAARLHEARTCA